MVYQLVLLFLQLFQVLFLWIHDWVPLGRLNHVTAVRNQDSFGRLLVVTLVQSVPWHNRPRWHRLVFGSSVPAVARSLALDHVRPAVYRPDPRLVDPLFVQTRTETGRTLPADVR
jgi:hypothetical protein